MNASKAKINEIIIITPDCYSDERGCFFESWSQKKYQDLGIPGPFLQDNVSYSKKGVLRGLHYQLSQAQGKLVSVLQGEVFDVAVDIRLGSPTFGKHHSEILSAENKKQMYISEGFAHGFLALTDDVLFLYKCTDFYSPKNEHTLVWNDPFLNIEWPINGPLVSKKDQEGERLKDIPKDKLPSYKL